MRAKLYVAHSLIMKDKKLKDFKQTKIPVPPEVFSNEADIEESAKKAMKMIGEGWVSRQNQTGFFSGVSVRNLADSYNFLHFYLTVYGYQSDVVHGMNATEYFTNEDGRLQLNLGPSPDGIENVLFLATAHMAGTAQIFSKRLGLGFDRAINVVMQYLSKKSKSPTNKVTLEDVRDILNQFTPRH